MSLAIAFPVKSVNISQPFGFDNRGHPKRKSFYKHFDNKHPGVDFALPIGTKVFASYPGIVVRREFHKGMGKVVAIRNGNFVSIYAHLDKFNVDLGDIVNSSFLIGLSGETGTACTEPHLHFELRNITKPTLKNMVINPPFGKRVTMHKESFIYKVNNSNTKKTWNSLSKLYFGTNRYWKTIANMNQSFNGQMNSVLPQGAEILIPNYPRRSS